LPGRTEESNNNPVRIDLNAVGIWMGYLLKPSLEYYCHNNLIGISIRNFLPHVICTVGSKSISYWVAL